MNGLFHRIHESLHVLHVISLIDRQRQDIGGPVVLPVLRLADVEDIRPQCRDVDFLRLQLLSQFPAAAQKQRIHEWAGRTDEGKFVPLAETLVKIRKIFFAATLDGVIVETAQQIGGQL